MMMVLRKRKNATGPRQAINGLPREACGNLGFLKLCISLRFREGIIMKLAAVFLVLGCAATSVPADDGQPPDASEKRSLLQERLRPTPEYRPYFYNYPHAIPADYVFRTSRVFSPQNMSRSFLPGIGLGQSADSGVSGAGQGVVLQAKIDQLGKALIANASEVVADEYVVAVSTFVTLDNLYATSSLGRYLGEQLLSTLQQAGIEVIEVRKTPGMMVSQSHGEFALSRSMDEIGLVQNAQAVVVGTYTVAGQQIIVNARLLRNEDNRVLSSAGMVLPIDAMTANLLANESMPASTIRTSQVGVRQFKEIDQDVLPPPIKKKTKGSAMRPIQKGGS